MVPHVEPVQAVDQKRGSLLKRFAWKWAELLLGALAVMMAGAVITAIQAVYTMPRRLQAVEVRTDTLTATVDSMRTEVSDIAVATWTSVGLECLKMTDSAMVVSRLALSCGRAFRASGITRTLTR
jgi:hypothetical protein